LTYKLGIFGDSFAPQQPDGNYPSWIDILSESYNVVCHRVPGSSLYESKILFDEYYKNYDCVVFIVTNPHRYQIKIANSYQTITSVNSCSVLQEKLNIPRYHEDWYKLEYAKQWLVLDPFPFGEYNMYVHNCILEDINDLHPNVLLIPAFNNSIPGNITCMSDITSKEFDNITVPANFYTHYTDLRSCYMSSTNNKIFADQVDRMLHSKLKSIDLAEYQPISADQFDSYFKKN
jgi:hypothetical protein